MSECDYGITLWSQAHKGCRDLFRQLNELLRLEGRLEQSVRIVKPPADNAAFIYFVNRRCLQFMLEIDTMRGRRIIGFCFRMQQALGDGDDLWRGVRRAHLDIGRVVLPAPGESRRRWLARDEVRRLWRGCAFTWEIQDGLWSNERNGLRLSLRFSTFCMRLTDNWFLGANLGGRECSAHFGKLPPS